MEASDEMVLVPLQAWPVETALPVISLDDRALHARLPVPAEHRDGKDAVREGLADAAVPGPRDPHWARGELASVGAGLEPNEVRLHRIVSAA